MAEQVFIEGTTPKIKYTYSTVNPNDMAVAILTIKKNNDLVLQKDLTQAEITENALIWKLSQSETLLLGALSYKMMVNFLLKDGTRGASKEVTIKGSRNHIEDIIE